MEIIFSLGIILVVGYFFGLIAEKFNFPRVTAYLISGVLFSEDLLGHLLNLHFNSWSEILVEICLGLIAFIVGVKINFSKVRENFSTVFWGTVSSSVLPMILVFLGFYFLASFFGLDSRLAIILASVASTTAPAATVAVIEQYKAKGKFTDTLLEIVALDDALGVVLFTLLTSFYFGDDVSSGILSIGKELLWSVAIGAGLGFSLSKFAHLSKTNDFLFPLLIGLVLIIVGLSGRIHFSPLLACIILGAISNNSFKNSKEVSLLLPIEHIEEFVFITFFTMAGTHFSFGYFKSVTPIIIAYVTLRAMGKYIGAYLGTKFSHNIGSNIPKWLGLALLPQAGIAIGLIFDVINREGLEDIKPLLINIILGSTIIYEILGPFCAKFALRKSGDLG
jgi:Kef-type K+ transport system membrane component KefB